MVRAVDIGAGSGGGRVGASAIFRTATAAAACFASFLSGLLVARESRDEVAARIARS